MNYFSLKLFDNLRYLIFYFIHILSYASKRYKKKREIKKNILIFLVIVNYTKS